jgi:AhpD family alkylhydroperoxidase
VVMYGRGGVSRAEREVAAVAAALVNGCGSSAALHARRYAALTKAPAAIEGCARSGRLRPGVPVRGGAVGPGHPRRAARHRDVRLGEPADAGPRRGPAARRGPGVSEPPRASSGPRPPRRGDKAILTRTGVPVATPGAAKPVERSRAGDSMVPRARPDDRPRAHAERPGPTGSPDRGVPAAGCSQ